MNYPGWGGAEHYWGYREAFDFRNSQRTGRKGPQHGSSCPFKKQQPLGNGRPSPSPAPSVPKLTGLNPDAYKPQTARPGGRGAFKRRRTTLPPSGRRCGASSAPAGSSGPAGRVSAATAAAGPGSAGARAARGDENEEATAAAAAAGEDGGPGQAGGGGAGGRVRPAGVRTRREGHAPGSRRPIAPPRARSRGPRARAAGRGGGVSRGAGDRACAAAAAGGRAARPLGSGARGGPGPALAIWRAGEPRGRRGRGRRRRQPVARRAERRSLRPGARPGPPLPAELRAPSPVPRPRRRRRCPHARGARRAATLGLWAISSGPELPARGGRCRPF